MLNAMSVDVEDYFQVSAFEKVVSRASWDTLESRVVGNTERLLELFDRSGIKATFFVLGWVAQRFPVLVRRIKATGHEVASHGYHHQLLYMLTPQQFREDVRSAKAVLEDCTGSVVIGFRAPSFSLIASTLWAIDILIEEGYRYDSSVFPVRHDRYGIPDAPRHIHAIERPSGALLEMPLSTVRFGGMNLPVSGGGYFRLLPYAWTRWGIRHINLVDQQPALFYLHPWEIDPNQPRIPVRFDNTPAPLLGFEAHLSAPVESGRGVSIRFCREGAEPRARPGLGSCHESSAFAGLCAHLMSVDFALGSSTMDPQAMTLVDVASEADGDAWDQFASRHPDASGYHAWAWRRVFERAFGHESIYLIARRGQGIEGILPLVQINSFLFGRMLTSLPFLNYGGVVADSQSVAQDLVEAATALARKRGCRHVELRHTKRRFVQLPCRQHKVAMRLRIGRGLWERLDRKVRNQVRKAQKSGLVAAAGGPELLNDFYGVFARNMRDLGTPVYSVRFFDEILNVFPNRTRLHVVRLNGKAVAAGLVYRTDTTVEVPWASSIREHNSLCPNHLLYWSVIEAAAESGCDLLDFGRSTPYEGTYAFKKQWGAEPLPLHWEYALTAGDALPDASPSNPKFRLAVSLWKRLPLGLATRVGPVIVRGIP